MKKFSVWANKSGLSVDGDCVGSQAGDVSHLLADFVGGQDVLHPGEGHQHQHGHNGHGHTDFDQGVTGLAGSVCLGGWVGLHGVLLQVELTKTENS
jgi:hypothetical protein